jgi:hypothetical protein
LVSEKLGAESGRAQKTRIPTSTRSAIVYSSWVIENSKCRALKIVGQPILRDLSRVTKGTAVLPVLDANELICVAAAVTPEHSSIMFFSITKLRGNQAIKGNAFGTN